MQPPCHSPRNKQTPLTYLHSPTPQQVQVSPLEAFQHYACLYIKYMLIFQKLEKCYDNMLHPQKRIDLKLVLQSVMARVIELKILLVRWNPPNPDVIPPGKARKVPFPWEYVVDHTHTATCTTWECALVTDDDDGVVLCAVLCVRYVNMDDILVDLKLPPDTLEVPVPQYFVEDKATYLRARNKVAYLSLCVHLWAAKQRRERSPTHSFAAVDSRLHGTQPGRRPREH